MTAMDGLGCIAKLIVNFIGLMTALRKEIIRIGDMDGRGSKGQSNEDCVHLIIKLQKREDYGKWNDRKCSETSLVAICQWPI